MPNAPRARILMVDDQPSNLLVLRAILEDTGQELVTASSGRDALRRLLEGDYALILLDVQMPGMDGMETATLIRERDRTRHTPIIFLTANDSSDVQAFRGYSVGAVDYLVKPLNPAVLRAKVGVFVDLFLKTEEVRRSVERLLEAERHESEQRIVRERLRHEIRFAGEVQRRLYPTAAPSHPRLDVFGASFPAEVAGGDYFDYLPLSDGEFGVAIGDVTGHGVGPALLMASTRAYLRALSLANAKLDEVLGLVNRALAADIADDLFVTLLAGRLDGDARTFRYTSAGHEPGWVFGPDGAVKAELESTAMPLGILQDGLFPEAPPVPLMAGDLILLLTDGLAEAMAAGGGESFGRDRTFDVVRQHRHRPTREIVRELSEAVLRHTGAVPPADDVTIMVIKVVG